MNINERKEKLIEQYCSSHPNLTRRGAALYCTELVFRLSEELVPVLDAWLLTGEEPDFRHGRFSIADIKDFRACGFIDALALMNAYINNPAVGEDMILSV